MWSSLSWGSPASGDSWQMDTGASMFCYNNWCAIKFAHQSKLRVTGLCAGNSPVTGEFSAQRASNAENVSIWSRHSAEQSALLIAQGIIAHYCIQRSNSTVRTRIRIRTHKTHPTYLQTDELLGVSCEHFEGKWPWQITDHTVPLCSRLAQLRTLRLGWLPQNRY